MDTVFVDAIILIEVKLWIWKPKYICIRMDYTLLFSTINHEAITECHCILFQALIEVTSITLLTSATYPDYLAECKEKIF